MATAGRDPMASPEEYLDAVEARPEGFATASEVAAAIGVERQTAHKHLQRLVDNGRLEKKKIGSSAVVWWVED